MGEILPYLQEMPDKVYFVNENGDFVDEPIKKNVPLEKYWSEKVNVLGILMLVSSGILILILLGESNLIQNVVKTISDLLGMIL